MKAILCERFGPPSTLTLADISMPAPGPGQVAIDVRACGINFPDVLMIEGKYQNRPDFPFSPGGEISGIVSALGDGVTQWAIGDRVLARIGHGGLREVAVTDAARCLRIPDGVDFPAAAALYLTYGTAHHALTDRAKIKSGDTMVVLGAAGGLGLALVDLGVLLGARVIACASSEEKIALAQSRGASAGVVYPSGAPSRDEQRAFSNTLKQLTAGRGADIVCDPVGGAYAEAALRATAWEGRYLVLGFTAGIPQFAANLALLKGCDIRGVNYGEFVARDPSRNAALLGDLLNWASTGRLSPYISATYPLDQGAAAIAALAERRALGKVVVIVGD